jgi:LAS superfamily LD-carboxypeptidase LdcB
MEIEEYEEEGDDHKKDLRKAEKRYEDIEESVGEALGTVEVLNKKSKVDPQLLQKYSKVYFLNEHYVPESVDSVPDEYTFGKEVLIHGKISSFAEDMFEDAEDDGIDLRTVSGFRSFGTQAALKSRYLVSYGSGANQFSADQGYSEHQLGTTLDFSTELLGDSFEAFGGTEAFEWMEDNAYKYGFTLSYPEGNAFYQYEPWHWRFVGKDLAKYLDRNNDYFYDVDQRKIDEYTADFFDR